MFVIDLGLVSITDPKFVRGSAPLFDDEKSREIHFYCVPETERNTTILVRCGYL